MFRKPKLSSSLVLKALGNVKDPDLGRDIVSLNMVKEVEVHKSKVQLTIELTTPACPLKEKIRGNAERAVLSLPGVESVEVTMTARVQQGKLFSGKQTLEGVKHIVAVPSGKGGALRFREIAGEVAARLSVLAVTGELIAQRKSNP